MCGKLEVGAHISLHLLDTPRGTMEMQLVAQTELGIEPQLRTKKTKLAIVHDPWKQRVGERERETKKENGEKEIRKLRHKERRQRWCK